MTDKVQSVRDWSGLDRQIRFAGHCCVCGSATFEISDDDGKTWQEPDPRGVVGYEHSASCYEAKAFGMVGPDVPACFRCKDSAGSYGAGLKLAREQWKERQE